MYRILIIGSGGAGKSTLARRIAERMELPLIHLDALYWQPGWMKTPEDQWRSTIADLVQREYWVMDGNYGGTLDQRLIACDTVILLDTPTVVCLWRVVRRRIRFQGGSRPGMTPGCPERLSIGFLTWIAFYRLRRRRSILERLATLAAEGKRAVILDSDAAIETFVAALPVKPRAPA